MGGGEEGREEWKEAVKFGSYVIPTPSPRALPDSSRYLYTRKLTSSLVMLIVPPNSSRWVRFI